MNKINLKSTKTNFNFFALAVFIVFFIFLLASCVPISYDTSIFQNALYSHLVLKNGSATVENFKLNYNHVTWASPQEKQTFVNNLHEFFNQYASDYNAFLKTKFAAVPYAPANFTTVVKENSNLIMAVNFPNSAIWQEATKLLTEQGDNQSEGEPENQNGQTQQITQNFFTVTIVDRTEKIGSVVKVNGQQLYFADFFQQKLNQYLLLNYPSVLNSGPVKSAYSYATDQKRRHSNADLVAFVGGKYFHQWDLTTPDKEIEFYSTYARAEMWYLTAFTLAFVTLVVVFLLGQINKKKKPEQPALLEQEKAKLFKLDE